MAKIMNRSKTLRWHDHEGDYSGTSFRTHITRSACNKRNQALRAAPGRTRFHPAPIATSTLTQFPPDQNGNPDQPPALHRTHKTGNPRKPETRNARIEVYEEGPSSPVSPLAGAQEPGCWPDCDPFLARLSPYSSMLGNTAIALLCTRERSFYREREQQKY